MCCLIAGRVTPAPFPRVSRGAHVTQVRGAPARAQAERAICRRQAAASSSVAVWCSGRPRRRPIALPQRTKKGYEKQRGAARAGAAKESPSAVGSPGAIIGSPGQTVGSPEGPIPRRDSYSWRGAGPRRIAATARPRDSQPPTPARPLRGAGGGGVRPGGRGSRGRTGGLGARGIAAGAGATAA
jgi:hypothetical protein